MIRGTLLWATGVILAQWQPSLISEKSALALMALAVSGMFFSSVRLPAALIAGFAWSSLHGNWALADRLPHEWEGVDLVATGLVASIPEQSGNRTRFRFEIETLGDGERSASNSGLVQLTWYGAPPRLGSGDHWQLQLRLKRPHGMYNPGTFDYLGWLLQQGIIATGYVRKSVLNSASPEHNEVALFDEMRLSIRDALIAVFGQQREGALLRALVIGDRQGIGSDEWELFRRTGTNHLMAISGLHIGIVSGWVFLFATTLWRLSSRLCLLLAAPRAAAIMALSAAFFYAGLSGFALPATRAVIMLAVVLGSVVATRQIRAFSALCTALLVILVLDPMAVLSSGFWLSFGAVAVILGGVTARIRKTKSHFMPVLISQWHVTVGLSPVLLALGFGISPVAPLINIVAIPLFSLVIVPLSLLSVLTLMISSDLGAPLIALTGWLLEKTVIVLEWVGDLAYPMLDFPSLPSWGLIALVVAVILLLLPRGVPGRWIALVIVIPLMGYRTTPIPYGEAELNLLDVGQGLAVVFSTRHHTLLYDTGPAFPGGFNSGDAVVIPFLREKGIELLDKVVVSNGDMDHRGGLSAVMKKIAVSELISGEPEALGFSQAKPCRAGDNWSWDGVDFHILHPSSGTVWRGNNASCVLSVTRGSGRVLIMGDLEKVGEKSLLERDPEALKADLVIVPHHGSLTSSSPPFVEAVSPQMALASSGYRNRYGFPKEPVVRRWQGVGSGLHTTATSGAMTIRLKSDGSLGVLDQYRKSAKRYWIEKVKKVGEN